MRTLKKNGKALFYDSEIDHTEHIFNRNNPKPLILEINAGSNNFLALCRRFGPGDDEMLLNNALVENRDYTYQGNTMTIDPCYLLTMPTSEYIVLSAVFDRGQSSVFSIYIHNGDDVKTVPLLDFDNLSDDVLEQGYKNEFFKSISVERENKFEGRNTVKLEYDLELWPDFVENYFEIYKKGFISCPRPYAIAMRIYGDGSYNKLTTRFYNRNRAVVFPQNDIFIDWIGWKKIYFAFSQDIALPLMWNDILRLSRGVNPKSLHGTLYIDEIEAICDPKILLNNKMGYPRQEQRFMPADMTLDFHGITKGRTTHFQLKNRGDYTPSPPISLVCEKALTTTGNVDGLKFPVLTFDDKGSLHTDFFTNTMPNGTEDIAFPIYAEGSHGDKTPTTWLVSAPKSTHYTSMPDRIVRNITKDPLTTAAYTCMTDIDTEICYFSLREKSKSDSQERLIPSKSKPAREAESSVYLQNTYVTLDRECLVHTFNIDNLKPGTEYICKIGSSSHWTATFSFKTFSDDSPSFSALIFSDAHNGDNVLKIHRFKNLLKEGYKRIRDQAFLISLGDLVNTASDLSGYKNTFDICRQFFTSLAFAPTPGNHERDILRWFDNYASHYNLPDCGISHYKNLLYSFDLYDYHFTSICADGIPVCDDMLAWLEKDLKDTDKKWKVVLMHCSPYGGKGVQSFNREIIAPILDAGEVDLCLSGHEHIYVRASIEKGKRVPIGKGTTYLTLGPAGTTAYENSKNYWQDYVYGDKYDERIIEGTPDSMITVARFSPQRIIIDVQMMSGRIVDYIVLEKP